MRKLRLEADCLKSKWGFDDGDAIVNFLYEIQEEGVDISAYEEMMDSYDKNNGLYDFPSRHLTLDALVRRTLLPLLPSTIKVYQIGTCHNPIRAESDTHHLIPDDVFVDVNQDQVFNAIRKVCGKLTAHEQMQWAAIEQAEEGGS